MFGRTRSRWLIGVLGGLTLMGGFLALSGCSTTYPSRDPVGETFPRVSGRALSGETMTFPDDTLGSPVLFLIGYVQDTQFDIDRWLLALTMAEVDVALYELPTIPGMGPRLVSSQIDGGMRKGIPEEDWGLVVTVYGDADAIARFTGNEDGPTIADREGGPSSAAPPGLLDTERRSSGTGGPSRGARAKLAGHGPPPARDRAARLLPRTRPER